MTKNSRTNFVQLVIRIFVAVSLVVSVASQGFECDFTDPECGWVWSDGFILLSADNSTHLTTGTAPPSDSKNDTKGQFLYYSPTIRGQNVKLQLLSPLFAPMTKDTCSLEISLHMYNMDVADFKIFIQSSAQNSTWETRNFVGNSLNKWERYPAEIGSVSQPFNVLLEVTYMTVVPSHLGIDDLKAMNCYNTKPTTDCAVGQFQCSDLICVLAHKVCNSVADCVDGEDEDQECDQVPESAFCTFEKNICGWNTSDTEFSTWVRRSGDSPNPRTGPSFDHTYQNETGMYMMAKFPPGRAFGSQADLNSPIFDPPPFYHRNIHSAFYNTCQVRFFFHKYGQHMGELRLYSYEFTPAESMPKRTELWRSYGNRGDTWHEAVVSIPDISNRYYLQFSGSRGVSHSDIAIDDVTLSPKCFGIGVPPNETAADPTKFDNKQSTESPVKSPVIQRVSFTTCGAKGRFGPNETLCQSAYHNTTTKITMADESGMQGFQMWKVPDNGIYTVFVNGAGGGNGVENRGKSFGASLRATFHWAKDEVIYLVVGQQGTDACSGLRAICEDEHMMGRRFKFKRDVSIIRKMNQKRDEGGAGGGGGATFVFKLDSVRRTYMALAVAGGAGGLSAVHKSEMYVNPQGLGVNNSVLPINGFSGVAAGGGGGWDDTTTHSSAGQSMKEGARGGRVCDRANVWETHGGFGGGGGGCGAGGGGGGYRGGDSSATESKYYNGYGGTSFISEDALRPLVEPGENKGDGSVTIVAAQPGCGCKHLCVLLDLDYKEYYCICPAALNLNIDGFSCNGGKSEDVSPTILVVIVLSIIIVLVVCAICIHFALNKYRKSHNYRDLSHEPLNNPEVQLNRLRNAGGMVTEYNPNYEFGGSTCSAQDLNEIPREQLTLVKALGQGAFGEVYEGFLTNPADNTEKQVAVKTLPEFSSSQAEMDFLMEALIMSKFNHPNIVTFIGVCFEKMPRFIVLELLQGGDLKSFLREHRPKPQKPSTLTISDLLRTALDVAKGCQYLEENHFIHRDIAARNCLLTTKEPNWVVKIADFGMARDIYRADYYRKGGKAMLPVKWMPPEAFLDGIFTTKTDIWSFGVLLWEVISVGFMPYPGRGNQEVMQLVTSGGRLEPPTNCPSPVYHIMMQCWHPLPSERPNFTTLIERLGYCLQDPDVINAELPVFNRPPSMERDATVVRPADEDSEGCLQVHRPEAGSLLSPGSEDYLIPMPHSMYSLTNTTTDRTDLQSSPSLGSSDQLLEMSDRGRSGGETPPSITIRPSPTWETNFMTPDSPPAQATSNASTPDDRAASPLPAKLKMNPNGYTAVPSEDTDSKIKSPKSTPNGPKSSDNRKSSIHSVDDLPIAPSVSAKNDNLSNDHNSKSNLSLDAAALAMQMSSGENLAMPKRYMNIDVNCNAGTDSNGSATRIGDSDQNLANRNSVLGSLDGYSGVNPVA